MKRIFFVILLFLISCKKQESVTPEPVSNLGVVDKVFICNEGNFNWANATISLYDKNEETIQDSVYYKANEFGLGDVCQSATYHGDNIYIVVNNSSKIEVISKSDFKRITTIDGFNSPRYFVSKNDQKGYVSDLYANKIWVVDLQNNTISNSIKCNGWTEEMVLSNDLLYVTNPEKEYVYVVNTSSDLMEDSIYVGAGVSSIQKDTNSIVWCLSSGDANNLPSLIMVNNDHTIQKFELDADASPSKLRYSAWDDKLYFINGDICVFDIQSQVIDPLFVPHNDRLFYGLGVDNNGDVYVSDAKDFVQKATCSIYTNIGSLKDTFEAGINTGYFVFE